MNPLAVVTGASQGLGFAFAQRLAEEGLRPVLIARSAARLGDAAAQIARESGIEPLVMSADVADAAALGRIAADVRASGAPLAWLVCNAGIVRTGTIETMAAEDIAAQVRTNLLGAMLAARAFMPLMTAGSRALFVSSGFGLMGPAGYAAYSASKAGMITFAEAVRREVHARKIGVYVAVPADIDTPGHANEMASAPGWMKRAAVRGPLLPAETAAARILRGCRGGRFVVYSDLSVRALAFATRVLPRRLRDWSIDRLFPRP